MMLNLTEVLVDHKKIEKEVPIELKRLNFSFGSFPVTDSSSAALTIRKEENILLIQGRATIQVVIPCDRCLEDVEVPLELDFVEKVPAEGESSPEEAGDGQEAETGKEDSAFEPDYYLEGYHLDVDKLLFGEALLNWPSRVLCKEDCRGLCPVCGQNLNHGDCGCERKALDPRMAKVLDVFSKFKEV